MEEKLIKTPELEIRVLANGIHIYKLADWSERGLEQWEESLNSRLDQATERVLSIYDMRHMSTVSRRGFTVVNRISTHQNIDLAYSAAVISSRRVSILVNTLTQMRRNNEHSRIFSDMDKALEWVLLKTKASFEMKRSSL
ncbi:MAG: hypothetical protein AB8G95_08180 [Anaerolineae bacterium]